MKRLTIFALSLFAALGPQAAAQSYDHNFVYTRTFLDSWGAASMNHCQYYDDLGREDQSVQIKVTPGGGNLFTAIQYDEAGRKWRETVPIYSGETDGRYLNDIFGQARFSRADQYPFTETGYEASPLNRVLTKTGGGAAWHEAGKRVRQDYSVNNTDVDGVFHARCYTVGDDYSIRPASPSLYRGGELRIELSVGEDNDSTLTFVDKEERTVLVRQRDRGVSHDTYYVYNDYGLLCHVLPPMTEGRTEPDILSLHAYSYRYDQRNRCVEKKLPGCEPVHMVYDRSDRMILKQDGTQRLTHRWTVYKYGNLGRLLYSFEHTDPTPVATLRSTLEQVLVYERDPQINSEPDPFGIGYTDRYCSSGSDRRLLSVNYYDDYNYLNQLNGGQRSALSFVAQSGYESQPGNPTGSLTGHRQYLMDGSGNFLVTAMYYDRKGQVTQQHSTNIRGGFDHDYHAYTFTGNPLKYLHQHTGVSGSVNLTEEYTYEYDHANRLTATNYSLNGGKSVLMSYNSYDNYGHLQKKSLHNLSHDIAYEYNIRDWTTSISGTSFKQRLHYHDGTGVPRYNGNISSMTWTAGTETTERGYRFSYDGMNRLTNAVYGEGSALNVSANRFDERVTGYDKSGNILGLKRYGRTSENSYGLVDDLSLAYNGNQLKSVTDGITGNAYGNGCEFKDGARQAVEYLYDESGNLTKDLNKKIADIQYNFLNLPNKVVFEDGSTISYLYDAAGTKLRVTRSTAGKTTTTDYCGNVIYENGTVNTLLTEAGFVSLNDNKYHYYLQDHQGNNRVVMDQNGNVEEVNHYYPFGGMFAASGNIQPYKYNGKELDTANGLNWYDYGARHYDAALGRWHAVDPLSEKYHGISPYAYCNNDPVMYIDPDGKDWRVKTMYNRETNKIEYHMSVNAVLYNNSSDQNIDMGKLATAMTQQINDVYSISDGGFVSTMDANIRVVNSVDEIGESDHVFRVVDQGELDKSYPQHGEGNVPADAFGFDVRISSQATGGIISGKDTRTVAHELGHTGGLHDLPYAKENRDRLMTQARNVDELGGVSNEATRLLHSDIKTIRDNYTQNRFTHSSPIVRRNGRRVISRQL